MKSKTIKLLTVCGSGIVTSSMIANKLTEMFEEEGYDVKAMEANPSELATYIAREHYDLVAYASPINEADLNGTPALPAISLITGRGEDEFLQKALEILKAAGK
ncbi:PTS fructose transporter subunit IIB [Clostridium sp. AL.422]|uniref:PTS fructose transporter subunit IIB n=1 Tax=Clostridium TaxID=1485 RepID=UPI00293DC12D|nr:MULTISPECIES: PTS fructose transporter subunit IIB [unclassified Clostridium]MDV4149948.1 PTS fructose transporter subunit IIB [Clostridium sp. AL.422]